jgi:membrane fusion protein (multidrug efflux system)
VDQRVERHREDGQAAPAKDGDGPNAFVSAVGSTRGRRWRLYGAIVAALVLVGAGGQWLYHQFTHVIVNDARVAADIVAISSRVPGWVTAVRVVEGDAVRKGVLLVGIDGRESHLVAQDLDAQLVGIARRRDEIEARITLTDRQTQSRIAAQQAAVRAADAAVARETAQRDLASTENDRYERLAPTGAVARADLDERRAKLETARQQLSSASADAANARANLSQAEAGREELTVLRRQLAQLGPEEERLRAQRARVALDIADRTIAMPFDGVVDQVFVREGEYVTPGQRLLMVHDPERVRVEANVKETDIRFLRPGKSVALTVDALPQRRFEGTVTRVGEAATSEFALLPNPNPSGNFTKITQRLPVRIAVAQERGLLKPGMMVELEIRTGD